MNYSDGRKRLADHRKRISSLRKEMRKIQMAIEPQEVDDYAFATVEGKARLSELFGKNDDLFIVHNMGASCPYCTLWADGYNGIYDHLASRAAFVVSSPDAPAAQQKFAERRGWRFPMVSHKGTTFAQDMGYGSKKDGWLPGTSVFRKDHGRILRVSDTSFGPGDDFCALWHFLDLLPGGAGDWRPRYSYA